MDKKDKISYRNTVSKELSDKENSIDNTVSYITVGLIAFFLTYNEKFINIISSSYRILMYLSVIFFIFSFIFGLLDKFYSVKYIKKIIAFTDNNDLSLDENENQLFSIWETSERVLKYLKRGLYFTLCLGVVLEIVFIAINIEKKASIDSEKAKVVNINNKDTVVVNCKDTFVVEKNCLKNIKK